MRVTAVLKNELVETATVPLTSSGEPPVASAEPLAPRVAPDPERFAAMTVFKV